MKTLKINASTVYPIYIGDGLLPTPLLRECCAQLNRRLVIITDTHLVNSWGRNCQAILQNQGLTAELFALPAGENHKTRQSKQALEDELLAKNYGRDTAVLAVGGGIVTDLAGFLAATYCRGIPVIYIPTTLLAMVDASIGGKTAVNTAFGKNLIGTFTQPHAVFIDISTLNTLPSREYANGMAEIIKHSVIADRQLFEYLQQQALAVKKRDPKVLIEIIYQSCKIKKNIVEQDEREQQGLRQLLNFGHTIGHAIEMVENYQINHGEAVAIGMLVESYLSVQCGYLPASALQALQQLLIDYDLPLATTAFTQPAALHQALKLDKKSINQVTHCVLLDDIGAPHGHCQSYAMPIPLSLLNQAFAWAAESFSQEIPAETTVIPARLCE